MFSIESSPNRLRVVALAAAGALATLTGCASEPSMLESCASLECLKRKAVREVRTVCLHDLFSYERDRARQDYINARYRYPLVSSENYQNWRRYGGVGPTPQEWCTDYAEQQVYRPVAARLTFSGG